MQRNSHNKSSQAVLTILGYLRKAGHMAMLGLRGRQWAACAIIWAMISLSVTAPTSVSAVRAADSELSKFEPVNEELPVWNQTWRHLTAEIEAKTTPWRPANRVATATPDGNASVNERAISADLPEPLVPATGELSEPLASATGFFPDPNPKTEGMRQDGGYSDADEKAATNALKDRPSVEPSAHAMANETKPDSLARETAPPPHAAIAARAMPAAPMLIQLPIEERSALFSPTNNLGTPPGQTEPGASNEAVATRTRERAGIANFGFDIPIAGLSGRGLDAGIGATYNSRVWTKSIASGGGNHFTYDVENSWLAAGFNLSLGYLELDYPAGQSPIPRILTDPNGTRHQLFSVGSGLYETADGTFIQVNGYTATYPDGTKIRYYTDLSTGYTQKHYPTAITDRHGNVIYTVYDADKSGRIKYIHDTLGRYTRFHYDTTPEKKLVAVTMPSLNAAPNSATSDPTLDRQTIRFYYETLTLQYQNRFDGVITVPNNGQIQVLKYVYFPGTKTGYQYDYSSSYGMIYRITRLAGMQVTTNSLTDTGSVLNTLDVEAAWTKYNYPGTDTEPPSPTLTDMPKYNKRIDEWVGRTGGGISPETYFNVVEDAANLKRTTTITTPDNTVSETIANLKPGLWDDGLIKETTVKNSGGGVMSKNAVTWEQGPTGAGGRLNPRVRRIDATNDVNLTKATVFEYVDLSGAVCQFNNVCQVKEYDYVSAGGALLRNTVTTYETGTNYINNRLLNLVKSVKVIVGATTVSRTEFSYDTQALTTYTNITNFDASYNPATGGPTTFCEPGCNGNTRGDCCWTIPGYNAQTGFRGNITQVKSWANAAVENDTLADITVINYDVTGNVVQTTANCCQLRKWVYTSTNQYAWPVQVKSGLNDELVTSFTYDFNTGLTKTSTNENNQTTTYEYESDTLRPKKTIYPNGGYVENFYSDKEQSGSNLVPGYARQKTTLEINKFVESYSYFDGRGLGIRGATQTPDGWSISAMEYDNLGRPKKSYNPYYGSSPTAAVPFGAKFSEVTAIDALGRTTQVRLQDNTSVYSYPNEAIVTYTAPNSQSVTGTASRVMDQANKERRQIVDALGRVRRVDEPTSSGLGAVTAPTQPTHYEYDGNDNLSKVIQSDGTTTQERRFKYDSLSRLTHEKQVEANATLNTNGVYGAIDPVNKWTKVLKYDSFGRLTEGTDARGVKTNFVEYDTLNRIKRITFSDGTPQVTYTYDQARSGSYNYGALTRVETAAGVAPTRPDTPATATEFDYDLMGRAVKHRQSIDTQTYALEYGYNLAGQLTSEKYPSGKQINFGYDANGRSASVADASRTYANNFQYQANGGMLSSFSLGNGTTQAFGFNDRLQMNSQEMKRGAEVLQKYAYGYGQLDVNGNLDTTKNNGQLSQVESWIGAAKQWTKKFSYDQLGRLSEEKELRGDNSAQVYKNVYDFDRFGNMYRKAANNASALPYNAIEDSHISKSTNRFASATLYDDAGNATQDTKFRNLNYSYDANGRMWKTSNTAQTSNSNAVYDDAGQRVATQVDSVWTFFVYDVFGKMVAEYGGLQSIDEGGVKYLLSDWQGSNRAVINNGGFVTSRMDYTAYGEDIGATIGQRTTAQGFGTTNNLRQKYGLTERDGATGLDHTWFRKNETRAGRWTSPDPYNGSMSLGNPQSFNRYSYVGNEPTNYVDPSGLFWAFTGCQLVWEWIPHIEGGGDWVAVAQVCSYQWVNIGPFGVGPPVTGGGGGGGGQGPISDPPKGDCARFLNKLDELAKKAGNIIAFMDSLAKTFIGVNSSGYSDMSTANVSSGERFTSTGWKTNLYDDINDNQARHFVGGLISGFRLFEYAGAIMGHGETSDADLRVNSISMALGRQIDNSDRDPIYSGRTGQETTPGKFNFQKLAGMLRDKLCD